MSFPKYPAYKDSGVVWIREIPVGWSIKPFWTLFRRVKRNDHAEKELLSVYRDYGVIPKSSRDDNFNKPSDDLAAYQLVKKNDLVINKMKAWQGSCAVSNFEGIVSPAYFVFSSISNNFGKFLHYLLRCDLYISYYYSISKGVRPNQWDLDPETHSRMPVILPPLPEQQAIASFLDRECGKIDALIAEQERLIALLAEKRQAVISHAVTKGLNPNALMKDSGIPWIGMVPEGWEVVKIKRVGRLKGGYAFSTDSFVETGIPVVRMSNLKRGEIDFSDAVFINNDSLVPSASLLVGDLVWGMSGSIGVTGSLGNYARVKKNDIPCQLNQRVGCFSLSKLDNDFMEFIVQADFFCDQIILSCTGTAQFNVSSSQVEDSYVVVPPMEDQRDISNFLRAYFQKQTTLYAKSEQSITLLKERRAALISAAVTGKIDVRAQSKAIAA